jgi:hypothetical protein
VGSLVQGSAKALPFFVPKNRVSTKSIFAKTNMRYPQKMGFLR